MLVRFVKYICQISNIVRTVITTIILYNHHSAKIRITVAITRIMALRIVMVV